MPFDGNGIYNPIAPPDFPAVPGTLIRASQYNNQIMDIASALTNCITADGQTQITGNIPMNSHRITGLASGTAPFDAATVAQVTASTKDMSKVETLDASWVTNSTMNAFASRIKLISAADSTSVLVTNAATIVNNISTAGPVANGRDQAAAFGTAWIYLYFIWNGVTLATVTSLNPPYNGGPTLPAGYTHWAFATPARVESNVLFNFRTRQNYYAWRAPYVIVSGGTGTSLTGLPLWGAAVCLNVGVRVQLKLRVIANTTSGAVTSYLKHSDDPNEILVFSNSVNGSNFWTDTVVYPVCHASASMQYRVNNSGAAGTAVPGAFLDCLGFDFFQ